MNENGRVSSDIPKYGAEPSGPRQSSGKTIHGRMKIAPKVERLAPIQKAKQK